MNLATNNLIFEGVNGEEVSFEGVKTIEQLEKVIVENYVWLCRKCVAETFCSFYVSQKIPCPLLTKVVHNYIRANIKSVQTENRYVLADFIRSIVLLIRILYNSQQWIAIYSNDSNNQFYQSRHPSLNLTFTHDLLVDLAKFSRAYRAVEVDRSKEIVILVEGLSEFEALPPILSALGVSGIDFKSSNTVKFINVKGKDSVQKTKIRDILTKYREDGVSYFLILDNDCGVEQYINDLIAEQLVEKDQCLVWDNKFEDNFGEEAILKLLEEEEPQISGKIRLDELKKVNLKKKDVAKSIQLIAQNAGINLSFDAYKVKIAKKLSFWICKEIEKSREVSPATYDFSLPPASKSFPEFIKKVKPIADKIEEISSEYHVIRA